MPGALENIGDSEKSESPLFGDEDLSIICPKDRIWITDLLTGVILNARAFSIETQLLKDYIVRIDGEPESVMALPKEMIKRLIREVWPDRDAG